MNYAGLPRRRALRYDVCECPGPRTLVDQARCTAGCLIVVCRDCARFAGLWVDIGDCRGRCDRLAHYPVGMQPRRPVPRKRHGKRRAQSLS